MNKKIIVFLMLVLSSLCLISCKEEQCADGNHTLSEWIITKDATCLTTGSRHQVCTICGEEINEEVIPRKEHTIAIDEGQDATCTEDGLTEGSHCSVCSTIIKEREVIKALGHSYILSSTKDGDNENEKILTYTCSRCHDSYEKVVEASQICEENHTEVIDERKEATCTEEGLTEGSHCSVCGVVIKVQEVIKAKGHELTLTETKAPTATEEGYLKYTCSLCGEETLQVLEKVTDYNPLESILITLSDSGSIVTNNNGGVLINGNEIKIIVAGEYDITGTLSSGNIIVTLGEEDKAILNLTGINLSSSNANPIYIESGDKVEISIKKDTENIINDTRVATGDDTGAAIYSEIDMEIKGKGELTVTSSYNNGIASKDDLEIKNATITVTAPNNAIKGNDSITITSGVITAISISGDSLKTDNSDISSKGNQRGIITIEDGTLNLYAACDGIDAAYDVIINGGTINIYTDKYSKYSGEVASTSSSKLYLKFTEKRGSSFPYNSYTYAALFTLEDGSEEWAMFTRDQTFSRDSIYYYTEKVASAKYVTFYAYSSGQASGQSTNYAFKTDMLALPTNDTYGISNYNASSKAFSGSWTSYTVQTGPGGMGGGMNQGNPNKASYSCKGIKADNAITINNGIIQIQSLDDAIHANSDNLLETGSYGIGDVTINGGTLIITTDDDAIRADNILTINDGNIKINTSYEGYEGYIINICGGTSSIVSLDDAINASTHNSANKINISGGVTYFNAGGDGLDSNGTITMTGGVVLAMGPTNGGNGVLDYDSSFTFSGGLIVATGASGMNQKPTAASGNTVSATTKSMANGSYVTVTVNNEVVAVLKITKASQNYLVFGYNNLSYPSATINVATSTNVTLVDGLYYVK